jgi:tetratricopeptide (TPR) repeat protein
MPSPHKKEKRPSYVLEWALIFVALVIAYSPALKGTLLWDDAGHITPPTLRSIGGLWRTWTEIGATQQYYPVLHSAFWFEHRLWGDSLLGYHLANVALHSLSAVLLILILHRLAIPGALLAGLIFALHPVMVESVAWISEQKNTLSAVFYLASAYCYLTFDDTRRPSRYVLASLLFACALLSKTVTATLPAALLVVIWWRQGRVEWTRDVLPLTPWFAVAIAGGVFTAWFEHSVIGAKGPEFSLTAIERCLVAGRVVWFYFSKLVWPSGLMFVYPHWTIHAHLWAPYLFPVLGLAVAGLLLALAGHTRAPLAGFLFFVGTLVPVLGFLNVYPFRFSYVADHFQYLASLGVIVPLAAGMTVVVQRRGWQTAGRVAAIALVLTLAVLTWRQAAIYHDAETLWRDTIARNPESWLAYINLGTELTNQHRFPEAIDAFGSALRLKPDYEQARHDLATAHIVVGTSLGQSAEKAPQAVLHLREALRLDPRNEKAHLSLGNLLLEMPGQMEQAIGEYEAALRITPDYFRAHYNLGTVLMDVPGRRDAAIAHLEAALAIEPDSPEAHVNLAVALADTPAKVPDAIRHLEIALAHRPDLAPARELLAQLRAGASPSR